MTTLTIKIPEAKATDLSKYVKNIGGEVITQKKDKINEDDLDIDNQVTHENFFGENIKRLIKAFN